jgi:hypothetical protein
MPSYSKKKKINKLIPKYPNACNYEIFLEEVGALLCSISRMNLKNDQ